MTDTTAGQASHLERLLAAAWAKKSTDLLLVVGRPPMKRVEGDLSPLDGEPVLAGDDVLKLVEPMLDAEHLRQFREEKETDFGLGIGDVARVRGNLYQQSGTAAAAFRLIPTSIPSMDAIGMPVAVRKLATLPQGLVLFTGPTGSGKSTSLAALLDWINTNRACHIVTIEDPVEYLHNHKKSVVSQREIGLDSQSFPRALRSALREDPDVILVGEMRDPESIAIALTLAETGHLVFSTLHTNDTSQALDRIVDVFPGDRQDQVRVQLAGSLSAVIAQRLMRRQGGGLVAAFEVLIATNAARNLIREGKTRQMRNILMTGAGDGMQTLEASLSKLVTEGAITYEDAVSRAILPAEVARPR